MPAHDPVKAFGIDRRQPLSTTLLTQDAPQAAIAITRHIADNIEDTRQYFSFCFGITPVTTPRLAPLISRQLVSLKLVIVLILVFRLVVGVRMIDVLGPEKRRRRSVQEKISIVQQSFEPGMTVSLVARQHGVAASQLFLWRKQYQEGSLTAVAAGEQVVPVSELASAMKQIKELQRLLGKKTMENELLKEAVEYGRQKKWIAHVPLLPEDGE